MSIYYSIANENKRFHHGYALFVSIYHCTDMFLHSIQGKWKPQRKSKLWFILAVPTNYNKWQRFKHIEKFIVLKHYRDEMREDNWRLMFRSSIVVPLVLMRMAVRLMLWARGFLLLGFSASTSSWESHSSTSPSLQAMLCSWLLPV